VTLFNFIALAALIIACVALWIANNATINLRKVKLNNRLLELRILISDMLHDIRIIALHFESFGLSKDSESVIDINSSLAEMEQNVLLVHNQLYASPLKFNDIALDNISQEFKRLNEQFDKVKMKIEMQMKKNAI